jgi:cell shape-determining protein MreC
MIHQFLDKKQIINKRKKIIQNVIGFGIFFILCAIGILSFSGQLFNFVGRPIWKVENFISQGFYNINYLFRTKASISNENHNLIEEISSLRTTMVDYQILKSDNDQLKEMLGRLTVRKDYVLGNILTKPNHSPYDTVIVDIGSDNGIKEGDLVYAGGTIPVGRVDRIYNKTSLITLFTNPGQKTEGFIDGSNASVELIGRGGGNFEMIIPLELLADKGTIIYMPGNTSEVLAIVQEVISTPTDPFKKVILSSPVNVQNLKWVEVKKD